MAATFMILPKLEPCSVSMYQSGLLQWWVGTEVAPIHACGSGMPSPVRMAVYAPQRHPHHSESETQRSPGTFNGAIHAIAPPSPAWF